MWSAEARRDDRMLDRRARVEPPLSVFRHSRQGDGLTTPVTLRPRRGFDSRCLVQTYLPTNSAIRPQRERVSFPGTFPPPLFSGGNFSLCLGRSRKRAPSRVSWLLWARPGDSASRRPSDGSGTCEPPFTPRAAFLASLSPFSSDFCNPSDGRETARMPWERPG